MLNQYHIPQIDISDYDYELPDEKIAFTPAAERDESKLLVFQDGVIHDAKFSDIASFLSDQDMLVFNNSKVIRARLIVHNKTGARIEIFCLEPLAPSSEISTIFKENRAVTWKCFIGNARKWKEPLTFEVAVDDTQLTIHADHERLDENSFQVHFRWDNPSITFAEWLEAYGKIPLPPYIKRETNPSDNERYQTIYAALEGSVAAPTAGLHFNEKTFQSLKEKGVQTAWTTLHVGAGTFKPISSDTIDQHQMHEEQIYVDSTLIKTLLAASDKRIIAVGTTVTRSLESIFIAGAKLCLNDSDPFTVHQWDPYKNQENKKWIDDITKEEALEAILAHLEHNQLDQAMIKSSLIIMPGYRLKMSKSILTNFHQPKSTLLLLISAYIGNNWKEIYQHALSHQYRFLSYGDANLYL